MNVPYPPETLPITPASDVVANAIAQTSPGQVTSPSQKAEEDSDSELPDAFSAIYDPDIQQVSTRRTGGRTQKYFHAVHQIPGQPEKFMLPSGADSCPVETCPRYARKCKPHWRLNEHMKLRHGWPRKNTQPHTDRRLSGSSQNTKRVTKSKSTSSSAKSNKHAVGSDNLDEQTDDSSELNDTDFKMDESENNAVTSSGRPKRAFKPTEKRKSYIDQLDTKPAPSPKVEKTPSHHRTRFSTGAALPKPPPVLYDSDTLMADEEVTSSLTDSTSTPVTPDSPNTVDSEMVKLIEQLIASLRADKTPARNANLKLAKDYQRLLDDDKFRVNAVMNTKDADTLLNLYRTLAERHNAQQQILQPPVMPPQPSPKVAYPHAPAITTSTSSSMSLPFHNTIVSPAQSQFSHYQQPVRIAADNWRHSTSAASPSAASPHAQYSLRAPSPAQCPTTDSARPSKKAKTKPPPDQDAPNRKPESIPRGISQQHVTKQDSEYSGAVLRSTIKSSKGKRPSPARYSLPNSSSEIHEATSPQPASNADEVVERSPAPSMSPPATAKTHHRNQVAMPRPASLTKSLLQTTSGFTAQNAKPKSASKPEAQANASPKTKAKTKVKASTSTSTSAKGRAKQVNGVARAGRNTSKNSPREDVIQTSSSVSSLPSSTVEEPEVKPKYKLTLKMNKK